MVPVFFVGQNSRLFQLASHLSLTLRLSLVFRETARRIGSRLKVRVGEPIPFEEIAHIEDRAELVMELRKRTFALARPEDIKGSNFDLHLREARIKGGKAEARSDRSQHPCWNLSLSSIVLWCSSGHSQMALPMVMSFVRTVLAAACNRLLMLAFAAAQRAGGRVARRQASCRSAGQAYDRAARVRLRRGLRQCRRRAIPTSARSASSRSATTARTCPSRARRNICASPASSSARR